MDGVTLLRRAQQAGLAVKAEGDTLIIRGPKRAEPIARLLIENKPDVLAVLAPPDAPDTTGRKSDAADWTSWRGRYAARITHWFRCGQRGWQEAERLALGEFILCWHRERGARPDPAHCAGCGDDVAPEAVLTLADGARLHCDGVRGVDCIIAYGTRWRGAAVAGLHALGIEPPEGFELL
jgi:hypothetical protein